MWAIAVTGWHGTVFSSGLSPHGDRVTTPNDPLIPYNWWLHLLQGDTVWASRFTVLDVHVYAWSNNGTLRNDARALQHRSSRPRSRTSSPGSVEDGSSVWTEYGAPSNGDTAAPCPRTDGPFNVNQITQYS